LKEMKKLLKIFLAALALTLLSGMFIFSAQATETEIVIFHTNDMHGRVKGDDEGIIGLERVAAIRKSVRDSILVDAGDALHGLPIATLDRGASIAALMNLAGYDAMVVGNHEFNYGFERLLELGNMARFPVFTSNVMKNGAPLMQTMAVIERKGVKIGLFGVATQATEHSAMPMYVKGLLFEDPVRVARETAEFLRGQGAQVVVALCHLGVVTDGTLSTELAQRVPEIDVIIDGHSHTVLEEGLLENGVLIAQTGHYLNNLGQVVIILEDGLIKSKNASLIGYDEAQKTTPDEAVAAKLSEITAKQDIVLKEPVGEAAEAMSSARAPGVRTREMPLGSLVADAYREAAEADLAITNGGDIRADVAPGVVTKGDVISILPFGNTLMVKKVTPALLRRVLENGVSGIVIDEQGDIDHEKSAQGRFLHVSGFRFAYDPAAPAGKRVVSITLDSGAALSLDDNETSFSLAGSNYVMTGGNEYDMLDELPVERELGAADEALSEFFKKHSPVAAPKEGRIK
jgi:2',3'-cyclic-nucleotide 2'-phosphodiesterase (5'-nucleotidase family)